MDLHLKEKVFIVTGGARGIGRAIVQGLAVEGAIPVVIDRSEKESRLLEKTIRNNGGDCLTIIAELPDPGVCEDAVHRTLEKFARIDGVVNNAGVNDSAGLENGSPEAFRKSLQTNLMHYYDLVYFALPALKRNGGAIVNISSKTAVTGQGGTSGYCASKGAQLSLTREWALDLAKYGIRVNAILPAEVMTPQYEQWINSVEDSVKTLEMIKSRIPLGKRLTTPEEIASMALLLLSDRSSHTTGQWIHVDGGYVHLDRALN